jgi:Txe/YoeB family toxin of Txe-Axe toxin-antitoxin module
MANKIEEIVNNYRKDWENKGILKWEKLIKDLNKLFKENK